MPGSLMKARLKAPGSAGALKEISVAIATEAMGYYWRPWGAGDAPKIWVENAQGRGLSIDTAHESKGGPDGAAEEAREVERAFEDFEPAEAQWETSAGNRLTAKAEGVDLIIEVEGRRHGIPWRFIESAGINLEELEVVECDKLTIKNQSPPMKEIHLRMTEEEHAKIKTAAKRAMQSLNKYILLAALSRARKEIEKK